MSEPSTASSATKPAPTSDHRPVSYIRKIFLGFVALVALLTFVAPWILPFTPPPFFLMVVVLFAPPLLPLRLPYKLLLLVALITLGPLLLHIRPPAGTASARQLAAAESRFFDTGQIEVHYQVSASRDPSPSNDESDRTLMLLHPGQPFSLTTWHKVTEPLSQDATVIAFDRPAAGLTAWPEELEGGESPYSPEAQTDQAVALMDHLGIGKAVLVGNSAGGNLALLTALRHPERISGLVLMAPSVYAGDNEGPPPWVRAALGTPQGRRIGQLVARNLATLGPEFYDAFWHDPKKQQPRDLLTYGETFRVDHWDRGFLELFRTSKPLGLPDRLKEVQVPVLVVTGDHDPWVPLDQSEQLAKALPDGRLKVLEACGHLPQQEQPEAFVQAVQGFLREALPSPW